MHCGDTVSLMDGRGSIAESTFLRTASRCRGEKESSCRKSKRKTVRAEYFHAGAMRSSLESIGVLVDEKTHA